MIGDCKPQFFLSRFVLKFLTFRDYDPKILMKRLDRINLSILLLSEKLKLDQHDSAINTRYKPTFGTQEMYAYNVVVSVTCIRNIGTFARGSYVPRSRECLVL